MSARASVSSEAGLGKNLLSNSQLLVALRTLQTAELRASISPWLLAGGSPLPLALLPSPFGNLQCGDLFFSKISRESLSARMALPYYVAYNAYIITYFHHLCCIHWLGASHSSCLWGGLSHTEVNIKNIKSGDQGVTLRSVFYTSCGTWLYKCAY